MADFTSWGLIEAQRDNLVFTGYTVANISAGWLVRASGGSCAADALTSAGLSSLAKGDIKIEPCVAADDASFCVGIALEDIPSGSYGSVGTRGLYIMRAGAGLSGGDRIAAAVGAAHASSANAIEEITEGTDDFSAIGVALTSASAAEKFVVVLLNV